MDDSDLEVLSEMSDFTALEFEDDEGKCDDDSDDVPTFDFKPCDDDLDDVDFDEALIPALVKKKSIEVLIDIDQDRKKVITLNDGKDNLEEALFKAIAEDTALKEYNDSVVIFQIFSQKFSTWVDLDRSKELTDGTHLKAIFKAKLEAGKESRHSHKHNKSRKRRQSDSSDDFKRLNAIHRRCKKQCHSSIDESSGIKRIYGGAQHTKFLNQDVQEFKINNPSVSRKGRVSEEQELPTVSVSRKGRVSEEQELPTVSQGELCCLSLGLSGKNPVSALHELCSRLRWGTPQFEIHTQSLISTDPQFLIKVTVKGQTYIPETSSRRKQLAKTVAAEYCLKKLGVFK